MVCVNPATDAIQGATYGEWVLLQDAETVSQFDLTIDTDPLFDWDTRLIEVIIWDGSAFMNIAPEDIVKLEQTIPTDPTNIQVTIYAEQTAVPTITGWYRISSTAADGTGRIPHRYGPWVVRRSMYMGGNVLP